jgi:hypothetical protein
MSFPFFLFPLPHLSIALFLSFPVFFLTHCRPDGTVNQIEGEATQSNLSEPAKLGVKFFKCKYLFLSGTFRDSWYANGRLESWIGILCHIRLSSIRVQHTIIYWTPTLCHTPTRHWNVMMSKTELVLSLWRGHTMWILMSNQSFTGKFSSVFHLERLKWKHIWHKP